ncbi:APY Apyrase, partial [Acromyrmex charruanus]
MYVLLLVLVLFQVCLGFTERGLFYPGRADLFELSIIHLNDFHARFEQTSPYSGVCREDHKKDCIGGIARVYTAVNQLMKERPNAIFLNAGDHFQGTLWYNIHRWNVTAVFMNMLPHDAMVIIRLKETGVNIIIVLSHCGLDVDRIMAAKCPLIDVIVGGHSHTFLYSGSPPFIDTPQDEYPVVVTQNETDRTVLIVQAAAYTKYLGNLTVWFDDQGEVVDWDGNPILLDQSIEEILKYPKILEALKPWKKVVDETALKKVGTTRILLLHNCYNQECNMGNLITDAMVNAVVDGAENKTHWTYAAVACMNPGGIRSSLEESDITYGDLMMVLPFENTWDTIELTGESIRKILEMRQMLVWSGLKITYKKVNETRSLVNVKIRCQACEYPVFENLVDNQWYRMIIPNFLMNDGDGFHIFKNKSRNHKTACFCYTRFTGYFASVTTTMRRLRENDGRGATSGKEVCVEGDREAAVPRSRAIPREEEDREEKER